MLFEISYLRSAVVVELSIPTKVLENTKGKESSSLPFVFHNKTIQKLSLVTWLIRNT
jgi:hypothetical protein